MDVLAVTGHRPEWLGGYGDEVFFALSDFAGRQLEALSPDRVITGMALGWDQAVAHACARLGIPFIAAVPIPNQEGRWPMPSRHRYVFLLGRAAEVYVVTSMEGDDVLPVSQAMQRRNEWMVDRARRVLALWCGSAGGTGNCVAYANRKGVPVENCWQQWADEALLRGLLG